MSFTLFTLQTAQAGQAAGVAVQAVPAPPAVAPPAQVPTTPEIAPDMLPPDIHVIDAEAIRHQIDAAFAQSQFPFGPNGPMYIPDELIGLVLGSLALILAMIIGYPIARALARRIDRQTVARTEAALPSPEVVARLERIEHAVETMAVEIERISEGQRFTNRLFSEQARELGAGRGASTTGAER